MSADTRTNSLWPIRPKPLCGEISSSWISRIASGLGFSFQEFRRLHLPSIALSRGDLDLVVAPQLFEVLARQSGITPATARQTSICLDGYPTYIDGTSERIRWIVPFRLKEAAKNKAALPYCPACLALDEIPHYRKAWRYAFYTACPAHGFLTDRCPNCGAPYNYLGPDLHGSTGVKSAQLDYCHSCKKKLLPIPGTATHDDRLVQLFPIQETLVSAIQTGWIDVDNRGKILAPLFFDGLSRIASLFLDRRFGPTAVPWTARAAGICIPSEPARYWLGKMETRPISIRASVTQLSAWLVQEWPHRFIKLCRELRIPVNAILHSPTNRPYWMFDPAIDMLAGSRRSYSTEERLSARRILVKRLGYAPNHADFLRFLATGQVTTAIPSDGSPKKYSSFGSVLASQHYVPSNAVTKERVEANFAQPNYITTYSIRMLMASQLREMDLDEASVDIPALEMQQRSWKARPTSG